MIDRTSPISGALPHVFVDLDGTGRCVCGQPRMTGVHVADDGSPVPDMLGLGRALAVVGAACLAVAERFLGEPAGHGIDPPLTRRQLLDIADALGLDLDQVVPDARR